MNSTLQYVGRILAATPGQIRTRWSSAWRDALASAIAALLAWVLAQRLFGHAHPVFAAISAIVCLAPGLPSHGKQAVGLMVGVATGIVVGEMALLLPDGFPLLRISFATFFAVVLAACYGLAAVVPIQAGVSAVLVLAVGPASAGVVRMIDVGVGASVGLIFSQILLTPNPIELIDQAAKDLLQKLALGFTQSMQAVDALDARKAKIALQLFSRAHESLVALDAGILSARNSARWSVRGRFVAKKVEDMANRYDRHAIRLYASTLLFGEAFANAIRKGVGAPPASLHNRLAEVATICSCIATDRMPAAGPGRAGPAAPEPVAEPWQTCIEHLAAVEEALATFQLTATSRDV